MKSEKERGESLGEQKTIYAAIYECDRSRNTLQRKNIIEDFNEW